MVRRFLFTLFLSTFALIAAAQQRPRLIVLVALDQCRQDFLDRFRPSFGTGGFERLRTTGAEFANCSFRHARTSTGPGHAVMLTGAYGEQNGIVTNRWYDPVSKKRIYCVQDDAVHTVGGKGTGVSPRNLMTYTLGDELKIR